MRRQISNRVTRCESLDCFAMTVAVLVLGAGRGERFRASLASDAPPSGPKVLTEIAGRSLLARSLERMAEAKCVDVVQPVLSDFAMDQWSALRAKLGVLGKLRDPVRGGRERVDSVRCGLAALEPAVDMVAVHDAARPLVPVVDIERVVAAAVAEGAAVLATPVTDTVHRVVRDLIVETPRRSELWAAATPQAFRRDWLEAALEATLDGAEATDDAGVVARLGHPVRVVRGDPGNIKITTEADRLAAEHRLLGEAPS